MEKRMRKKITAIILTFALAISLMPSMTLSAMAEASGSWSDAANMSEPAYNSGTHTYTITSSAELAWFANAVNTGNIPIPMDSNATVSAPGGIDLSAHTWVPIGNGHDYTGTFDGGSCTITGLTISSVLDSGSQNNIGLFGNISGATISDVALSGVSISLSSGYSEDCVGALAGVANGSSITHCSAAGSITLTCGGQASGGLVGSGDDLSVTDCSSSVEVTSNYRNIGGLAGQVGSLSSISSISSINRSFATGNVSVLADGFIWLSCGGLIGTLGGTLEKSYATGSVMGSFTCGGGLIGRLLNGSNITNSYETGDVRGTSPNTAGGLVGNMEGGNCSISYAYSAGIAGASSWNGGFIGYYGGDDNTLSDVYYNIANVYCYKNTSSLLSGVIGMTLTDMKTSEFANTLNTLNAGVWSYDSEQNGGYPHLVLSVPTYTVSGALTYSGLVMSGLTVTLKGGSDSVVGTGTTDSDGVYTIDNQVEAGSYTAVVPALEGYYEETTSAVTVSSGTVSGASFSLTKSTGAPDYFITRDSGDFLVNGSGSYATLASALSTGCVGVSGPTIYFGTPGGSLSVAETTAIGNNALISATYKGSVVITENAAGSSYGLTIGNGVSAIFSGLTITDDTGNMTCSGTNPHFWMVYVSGGSLDFRSSSIVADCANAEAAALLNGGSMNMSDGTISVTGSSASGIENAGSGALTISGGTITSSAGNCISAGSTGTLMISGGTITNNGNAYCIYDNGSGAISLTGGTLTASNLYAIWNRSSAPITVDGASVSGKMYGIYNMGTGNLTLKSGTVATTGSYAVYNSGAAAIEICGATVSTSGSSVMYGIYNNSTGSITMSSGSITCSSNGSYGIYNNGLGNVTITGGTITGTAYGIYNNSSGAVTVSGGTVKNTGSTGCAVYESGTSSGAVTVSSPATLSSVSASTVKLAKYSAADTAYADLFGVKFYGHNAADLAITGVLSDGVYSITLENHTASTVNATGTTSGYSFVSWTSDAARTNAISTTNGASISALTAGDNTHIYANILNCVVLAAGSPGTAGDGKITGLTSGTKYKVTSGPTTYYVRANGTLSTIKADVGALTGTEVTGLTNGTAYLVEVYTPAITYTVTYDGNGSSGGTVPEDGGEYENGDGVTVLGNTGGFVKTGYTFAGWTNNASGTGTVYEAGDTYTMGDVDVTFYAKWTDPSVWDGTVDDAFGGGAGSEEEPYEIETPAQLAYLAKVINDPLTNASYSPLHYELTADLDLNEKQWTPIGDKTNMFTGVFDGNGHAVSKLTIGTSDTPNLTFQYAGLFGYMNNATIQNIGVEGAAVYSSYGGPTPSSPNPFGYFGALAGSAGSTAFKNVYTTGTVFASGLFASTGGIAGAADSSVITNSYSTCDVTGVGSGATGGLFGRFANNNCSISNCYAACTVSGGGGFQTGCIAGYVASCTITNGYYLEYVGGPAGVGSFLDPDPTTAMSSSDMKAADFLTTLNTNATVLKAADSTIRSWKFVSGANGGYPMLSGVGNTQTFSVLYDGNGSDSGTVPADGGEYADGANVTVLGNTGSLEKAGYTFAGWNTESNGNGTNYIANQTFAMGAADVTLYAKWTAESTGSHHSSSPEPTRNTNATVIIGGESQNAGTIATSSEGGRSITKVSVDDGKLEEILEEKGGNAAVTIPVNTGADIVTCILSGQTVKNMESKETVLEIRTESVTYTLPASEINIDSVSAQIGEQVQLADIEVNVSIAAPPQDTVKIVENTANINNYRVVVKPVEFEITCTYGNKTVDVSEFNGYVERTVVIPDGIDPSKITTGIVLNANGALSHVPTTILVIGGKYYAKLNSLTNSVYSVIYNPIEFADVISHWAKDAVNDMGSRLVVSGIGNGNFGPDNDITRAEFAAIVVRALGLRAGTGENKFSDVKTADWYCGYTETASSYGIINGYTDGSFGPNDKITREQAMAMVERAMKITKLEPGLSDSEISALLDGYSDLSQASDYAKPGIAACLKTGVITGKSSDTVAPKDYITRAEVAVIVRRLLQKSDLI